MKKYVLHRFLQLIPILLGITFLSFAMMRLAGSDVVTEMYQNRGTEVSQEIIDAKRAELGLDQPFLIQYGRWLGGMLTGDMGESYMTGKTGVSYFSFQTSGNLASDSFIHYPYHTGVDPFWHTCSGYA